MVRVENEKLIVEIDLIGITAAEFIDDVMFEFRDLVRGYRYDDPRCECPFYRMLELTAAMSLSCEQMQKGLSGKNN